MIKPSLVDITAGDYRFTARFEHERAPKTCEHFLGALPYQDRIIHVRWSGEGCWIPMGENHIDLPWEDATCYPPPGQFIFYPGGQSEVEILLAYGSVSFASKAGALAGNPFLTIVEGGERLAEMGRAILWGGALDIRFAVKPS